MRLDDLTLEVRDRTLKRVGQVTAPFLNLKARTKWSAVGEWTLTLPGSHAMVPYLQAPGSGIILLGPDGTASNVILSGPTRTPARKRDRQNPDGTYTFSGVTDEILLAGARAFPDPAIADPQASSQSRSNDTRTGKTEDLLRQYVAYNIANGAVRPAGAVSWAPAGRLRGFRSRLVLAEPGGSRGVTQVKSPRFQNLLEVLQELVAVDPALGFRVVQVGALLEFQVLDSRDRTAFVRFDVENGTLASEEVQASGPVVTDAIVAGQGEGSARTIVRRQTLDALAAEEEWGIPFEEFIDQRDTDDLTELQQSGDAALLEGQGGYAVKMVPTDDTTMEVGRDWRAGDLVTTVVSGIEAAARVTEVAYLADPSGVMAGAALGDVSGFTAKDAESATVKSLDSRVSNLERASSGPDVLNPTGIIAPFGGATAPAGWLLCDGAAVSRSTYSALFAVIGTTHGAGDGSTTFNLPNLKGRTVVGLDAAQTEFNTRGKQGGSKTHTLAGSEIPPHFHRLGDNYGGNVGYSEGSAGARTMYTTGYGPTRTSPANDLKTGTQDTTTGQAHNNLQPYVVENFIIKT